MRKIFNFWWLCAKRAARGSAACSNDWQWLFGFPALAAVLSLARRWFGEGAVNLNTDTALGALAAAVAAFVITLVGGFFIRLFGNASNLYYEEKDRADSLQARLNAKSEIPDLDVTVATLPQIWSTKIEDPPPKEGLYIFIRDIQFTNRSPMPVSIEVQLHIFLGNDVSSAPFLCPKQENIPFPGMEQARGITDASLGPHLEGSLQFQQCQRHMVI